VKSGKSYVHMVTVIKTAFKPVQFVKQGPAMTGAFMTLRLYTN
jgi:hypothetical protein